MQFQVVLSNQHHPESGVVTVPFPIPRAEYDNTIALLEPLEIGDAVRRDCRIDEVSGGFPVLKQLERTNVNLDELDYLAKRLDSFDDYEKTEFQGMASRLDLHGVDEFINLTFCCQEVTVVTDFNNLESLGRRHYLTLGGGASMEEMQGRDFRSVALALLDGEVGRVTPYGVVYDNGFEMSKLYDGHSFPQYRYAMMMLAIQTGLRVVDISGLTFESIDWHSSEFHVVQHKTGRALSLPMEPEVGNAIADYILNGRPECECSFVFLSKDAPYGNTQYSGYFGYAGVGNVLIVDWDGSPARDTLDHAMVVTDVSGTSGSRTTSQVKVAAHTSATNSAYETVAAYTGMSASAFARVVISAGYYSTTQP